MVLEPIGVSFRTSLKSRLQSNAIATVTAHPLINCNCSPPNKELSDVALTIKLASEQYGLGVKAFVLNLLVAQMVSFNRAQTLLKNLIDLQKG